MWIDAIFRAYLEMFYLPYLPYRREKPQERVE
jgi:hypothetical protein